MGTRIAAGAADATSLKVGLATASAGLFNGSATLALASHNADLTDLALTPVALTLAGQANNFGKLDLTKLGGAGDDQAESARGAGGLRFLEVKSSPREWGG